MSAVVALHPDDAVTVAAAPVALPAAPRTGLTGVGTRERTALQKEVGAGALDGWTQEVADRFDVDRATAISDAGGMPWLTLVLSRRGEPTLEGSLTAIGNGVDDEVLAAWARQLAQFGRPLYLTVLPAVDRNYAATSAVTRGGIPADAPRAWARMHTVFRAAGATNVAWVWSPADPTADQAYHPAADQIDLVAVTMYQYQGRPWLDPARRLSQVARAHPGKPLVVDVSVAGPAVRRASWLASVGRAVQVRRDVAAVTYHPTGPYADLSRAEAAAWRPDRDPVVLGALRGMFERVRRS